MVIKVGCITFKFFIILNLEIRKAKHSFLPSTIPLGKKPVPGDHKIG